MKHRVRCRRGHGSHGTKFILRRQENADACPPVPEYLMPSAFGWQAAVDAAPRPGPPAPDTTRSCCATT
eukprot:scaffold35539_cov35-Tisochrysis_lutea.AAC.4